MKAGVELALAVFPEASAFFQPGEGTLHYPSFWDHGKSMKLITFDDFHRTTQQFLDGPGEVVATITGVGEDILHLGQSFLVAGKGFQCPRTVGHVGRGDLNGVGQTLGIHGNMPLDAGHLLSGVKTLMLRGVRVLHALRVHDAKARVLLPTIALSGLANQFFLRLPQGHCLCRHPAARSIG